MHHGTVLTAETSSFSHTMLPYQSHSKCWNTKFSPSHQLKYWQTGSASSHLGSSTCSIAVKQSMGSNTTCKGWCKIVGGGEWIRSGRKWSDNRELELGRCRGCYMRCLRRIRKFTLLRLNDEFGAFLWLEFEHDEE
ncbi:hypothetical protein BUALT_Bualt17G0071800 [Buddleja alternifolia]|uniref:Uncharacterized protein n=1 Tax=Buddleja alternifolia TaxID=168488 RepID=A0AAV6WEF4_9LAMI|nr:hypothetical protein BUALT_Bualt17G0071800 [Buddleja alternifolia]